ncbi:MAG: hypothetical protein LKE39_11285 [Sphaerochaeta sp.]|jgi:cell division protein FtsL|nr:hypothetical protein [Sphaerochaeta sp.]MCH3921019.1 hypothetical protein [Sphaerochaeta sp.]MCI2045321.1 hypothetical protein [Sphaerochaeta sp.]MCI2076464.1 hypothetical protein [Sphaerochaeta sp.]MCI2097050.1 hypothetical protein [Sphaerochaeta sp.]
MNSLIDRDFDVNDISQPIEKGHEATVSKFSHAVAIAMLVFILAVVFAVVWMEGVDHTLQTDVTDLESQISQLEEQHRSLRARLAIQGMPEDLVRRAIIEGVTFERIDAPDILLVGGEG